METSPINKSVEDTSEAKVILSDNYVHGNAVKDTSKAGKNPSETVKDTNDLNVAVKKPLAGEDATKTNGAKMKDSTSKEVNIEDENVAIKVKFNMTDYEGKSKIDLLLSKPYYFPGPLKSCFLT